MSTDPALPRLFSEIPEPFRSAYDPQAPWALLGDALDAVLDTLPSEELAVRPSPDVHLIGDRIVVGKGTRIGPGAVIEGPIWIGEEVVIRPGAYLRSGCWIGDEALVGASTEIKRGILFPGARAPHLNYVGDSILGAGVNLGAGTVLSNFRHDGSQVLIPIGSEQGRGDAGSVPNERVETGRRKLGAVLGDGVLTGCNCVLNPGTVVGRDTQIYPGAVLRPGVYPAASLIKLRQETVIAPKR
jgi:NDP-sugar pyrophosphorylase family protein